MSQHSNRSSRYRPLGRVQPSREDGIYVIRELYQLWFNEASPGPWDVYPDISQIERIWNDNASAYLNEELGEVFVIVNLECAFDHFKLWAERHPHAFNGNETPVILFGLWYARSEFGCVPEPPFVEDEPF